MTFPGGTVALPEELIHSGKSGSTQVTAPERPIQLSRMSTESLTRLHDELGALVMLERDGQLRDYMQLLVTQANEELVRRAKQ